MKLRTPLKYARRVFKESFVVPGDEASHANACDGFCGARVPLLARRGGHSRRGSARISSARACVLGSECIRVAVEALSVSKLLRFVHGSGAW